MAKINMQRMEKLMQQFEYEIDDEKNNPMINKEYRLQRAVTILGRIVFMLVKSLKETVQE